MARAASLVACVAGLAVMSACYAPPDPAGTSFTCIEDDRCPSGYTCVDDHCVIDGSSGGDGNAFVRFPGTEVTRGCMPGPDCPADAQPARTLEIGSFLLQRNEVSQGEYDACVQVGRCAAPPAELYTPATTPALPARGMTWASADAYCRFVQARLPTEAEWERAARDDGGPYPWGQAAPSCARATYSGCGAIQPARTGGATSKDVRDLAGNVREWVNDYYAADYYATEDDLSNPHGPLAGTHRVTRGGSSVLPASALLVWARAPQDAASISAAELGDIGFRCADDTDD